MNIKEKWQSYRTWKKTKIEEFNEKHPVLADAIIRTQIALSVGLAIGTTYVIGYSNGHNDYEQKLIEAADKAKKEKEKPTLAPWKEEYKENYDKALEFRDSLNLAEGEQLVFSDSSVYNDPTLKPVIVDHFVYKRPCYPPDEDIKWLD